MVFWPPALYGVWGPYPWPAGMLFFLLLLVYISKIYHGVGVNAITRITSVNALIMCPKFLFLISS